MLIEEEEIWKDIVNYEGYYQVSNLGRIRSVDRMEDGPYGCRRPRKGKIKKFNKDGHRYSTVNLDKDGKSTRTDVHRHVAIAFIPNPENKKHVNHIKGREKKNNRVDNLEWNTPSENNLHAIRTGLRAIKRGMDHNMVKLTDDNVLFIRANVELSVIELSEKFSVGSETIRAVRCGKIWKHIGGLVTPLVKRNKITVIDVIEIRRLYAEENLSQKEISVLYGVKKHHISNIITGVKWKSVGGIISLNNRTGKRRFNKVA